MAISRISSTALFQTTVNGAIDTQNRLFNAQQQISSGLKAQDFAALDGQVELFTSVEARLSKTDVYIKNNEVVQTRINTTDKAVGNIIDTANDLKNLIAQRRTLTQANSLAFEQQIEQGYRALAGFLNSTISGRFLFAGARTDQKPIDEDQFPSNVELGVPDSGYYQGSTEDLTARIQDDFEISYNVRGDDEGFQKIFAALALASEGHGEGSDALFADAYDMMQEGIDRLITVQAEVGINAGRVEQANQTHEAQNLYWKGVKEETINSDLVALSTQVAMDQAILQAAFQSFARINSLQLSDFLR